MSSWRRVYPLRNFQAPSLKFLTYAAPEQIDNKLISDISISKTTKISTENEKILSDSVVELSGKTKNEKFSLIPYYIWSNRGVGKMKIWFPELSKQLK